jgi:hypothetical protein
MMSLSFYIAAIKQWIDVADWRSWIAHAIVAVPIAALFGFTPVVVLFAAREAEQALLYVAARERPHWLDHVMDVVAPALVAALWL